MLHNTQPNILNTYFDKLINASITLHCNFRKILETKFPPNHFTSVCGKHLAKTDGIKLSFTSQLWYFPSNKNNNNKHNDRDENATRRRQRTPQNAFQTRKSLPRKVEQWTSITLFRAAAALAPRPPQKRVVLFHNPEKVFHDTALPPQLACNATTTKILPQKSSEFCSIIRLRSHGVIFFLSGFLNYFFSLSFSHAKSITWASRKKIKIKRLSRHRNSLSSLIIYNQARTVRHCQQMHERTGVHLTVWHFLLGKRKFTHVRSLHRGG